MKITFLGTGSSIPSPKIKGKPFRSYAGLLIEIRDEKLLFDPGPGSLVKLQQLGYDTRLYPSFTFITHLHLDHCQDIPALLKGRAFNPTTGKQIKGEPITIFGPKKTRNLFSQGVFTQSWEYMQSLLHVWDFAVIEEVTNGIVNKTDKWTVSCTPIKHADGVAYKIEAEGKVIVYSGDMGYDEAITILGKDADIAILECSFPSRETLQGSHLCPEDIAVLGQKGKFKKILLTHLYPPCEGKEGEIIEKIESQTNIPVTIAYDFFTLEV